MVYQYSNNPHTAKEYPLRKLIVAQAKGGTAKTTTAVNVAAGLAQAGYNTLLVDLDTQGQVASVLGVQPPVGMAEFMFGDVTVQQAVAQARDRLWILAGGPALAGVKRMIARQDYGGEHMVTKAMAVFEGQYDYVILDTPPSWDTLNVAALFYATEILVPVSLEAMALQGLVQFMERIKDIQAYRPELRICAILPTFLDRRVRQSEEILGQLKTYYGPLLYPPIRYNVRLSEAPIYKQTIYEYAPHSPGAMDYQQVVERIIQDGHA
jgi:chromosome partitioning protein